VTAQEVIKRLRDEGWYEVKQTGSHKKLKHDTRPGIVTVTMHKGDIPKGTLASIFRQAGWGTQP
jgi:predicted RNA binding protein YcfA (HicA-like mRNA interferase family)